MFCRGLLQRIKLDVAEENLRPLGLKKDLPASGKRTRSLIDESAIDILFYAACLVYQLENIPLAVRLLHFSGGIECVSQKRKDPFSIRGGGGFLPQHQALSAE